MRTRWIYLLMAAGFVFLPPARAEEDMTEALHRFLSEGLESRETEPQPKRRGDPLRVVAGDMDEATKSLWALETGPKVQAVQQGIVEQLGELIASLERSCSSCGGGGSGTGTARPDSPMPDSQIAGGPGGVGELHAPRLGRKSWAELPPHEREKILQSKTDGFPPGYESILQRYFRSLADETLADETLPGMSDGVEGP